MEKAKEVRIAMPDGFYIAELKHPSHKTQRIVVQVKANGFMGNDFFERRSIKEGLEHCYKLVGFIHLDTMQVEPMLNDIKVKNLTGAIQ